MKLYPKLIDVNDEDDYLKVNNQKRKQQRLNNDHDDQCTSTNDVTYDEDHIVHGPSAISYEIKEKETRGTNHKSNNPVQN